MLNQTTSGFSLRIVRTSRADVSSESKRQQRSMLKPSSSCPAFISSARSTSSTSALSRSAEARWKPYSFRSPRLGGKHVTKHIRKGDDFVRRAGEDTADSARVDIRTSRRNVASVKRHYDSYKVSTGCPSER